MIVITVGDIVGGAVILLLVSLSLAAYVQSKLRKRRQGKDPF